MDCWSLQDAKNKFSQVVELATTQGRPQFITKRGKNSAVLLSYEDYARLVRPRQTLLDSLLPDEPIGDDLDIQRASDFGRELPL